MQLTQLRLHNFRSYGQLKLMPPGGTTVFVGDNGAGKTNLLEAVHLCCLGRSHRTRVDQDMIRMGCETSAVQASVQRQFRTDDVGVRLFQQQQRNKLIYVDGKVVQRIGELMGHMTCVMFSPEDLDIIKGGPQLRRRFLDMLLSQCMPSYFYTLQRYASALKQRNALLRAVSRFGADASALPEWEAQLAMAAVPIIRARQETTEQLNLASALHYERISGRPQERLGLQYRGHGYGEPNPEAHLLTRLQAARDEDIRRMSTSIGPHRDELLFTLSGQELPAFGSQGQIRTAVLALRLSEIDILTAAQGETPLLLLDDVLSELDMGRRLRLIQGLSHVQTFVTCTDLGDIEGLRPAAVLHVKEGEILSEG